MLIRTYSLFGLFLAFGTACSGTPKTTAPESSSSATITIRETKAQKTNFAPTAATIEEFKNSKREIFDDDQVHFNADPAIWKKLSDSEGIQTYEKINANDQVVAFRGEALIPSNLTKIAAVLNQPELRKEWIDSLAESFTIEKTNDFNRVEYNHTKVPWPFQDRDFVYRVNVRVDRTAPTMLITMKSTSHSAAPLKKGIVRGEMIYSLTYMKQLKGIRATRVVVEMAVDPKGAIPKWLVNLSQRKWPFNTLLALKKISQREDLVVSKEIEEYFKEKKKPAKAALKSTKKTS